jgi:hypothetical protein
MPRWTNALIDSSLTPDAPYGQLVWGAQVRLYH